MPEVTLTLPEAIRRANAAFAQGRHDQAEQICRAILGAKADHFEARYLLAAIQSRRGRHVEGLANYERALKLRPDHAQAHYNCGVSLQALNRFDEALASYDRALAVQPDFAEAFNNRAIVLIEMKRFEEALASCDRALSLRPDYAMALNNRGIAMKGLTRFDDSLESYDRALALQPDFAEALNNRAVTLMEMNRFAEALASCDRALSLRAKYAEALNNRGNALRNLRRFDESLASCEQAIALRPNYADAHISRGVTLMEQKRFGEALVGYEKAISLNAGNADAHFNAAHCRLLIGDFDHGWRENEWRWKISQARNDKQDFEQPQWSGREEIAGKTILLHAEQGLGDTIQFCRYARLVKQRGARVILQVQPSLKRLLAGLPGADVVLARGEPLPPFDLHCPLLSLPRAFGTRLATIPPMRPLLSAPPQLRPTWESRLGPKLKPRIGIAWSGRPTHKHDHNRSISLRALLGLLELPLQLVSLQKEVRNEDQELLGAQGSGIMHFGPSLTDFSETAALASLMDLVVSVDSSVAHLSAALGRPTWILLPFIPDWRWMLDREDTPWYQSARLFRQQRAGEWGEVIARVALAISEFAAVVREVEAPRTPDQIAARGLAGR